MNMNLYRNFGNLLEAWVANGVPFSFSDEQTLTLSDTSNTTTPVSTQPSTPDLGINLRSESDDSGFEITTGSSDAADSLPSSGNPQLTPMSVLTDGEERGSPTPSSTLTSPLRSSARSSVSASSVSLFLPGDAAAATAAAPVTRDRAMTLHHKVEQALLKITPSGRKTRSDSNPNLYAAAHRRVPKKTPSLPRHNTAVRIVRSESVSVAKTSQLCLRPAWHQRSDRQRRPVSLYRDTRLTETHIEEESEEARDEEELSPGLSYLEQVCQMWEEIAQLQIHNRELHAEMDVLRDHRGTQSESCPCSRETIPEDQHNDAHKTHLAEFERVTQWQRSDTDDKCGKTSETETLTRHSRSLKPHTRGQPVSERLRTEPAEDPNQVTRGEKKGKMWMIRKAPSRKEATGLDSDGHRSRPSQAKRTTSHRLSQLFRGARTSPPS